jgi:hypothetical protein
VSFFSSEAFLGALASAYFPAQQTRIADFALGERIFRLLDVPGRGPVANWPFMDYLEALRPEEAPDPKGAVRYVAQAVHTIETVDGWPLVPLGPGFLPSPFVRWSAFPDFETFRAHVHARRSSLWADSRRQARRIERERGALEFAFHDPRPETLLQALGWKSQQYVASGHQDLFAITGHKQLFLEMAQRGALRVSTLSAGGNLIAAHVGALHAERFYYWIPAYAGELAAYSPGRLLLEWLLAESQRQRHQEFDFLIGDEPYKWLYATHVRRVGPLGRPPLTLRLRRALGTVSRKGLGWSPRALDLIRRLARRWRH